MTGDQRSYTDSQVHACITLMLVVCFASMVVARWAPDVIFWTWFGGVGLLAWLAVVQWRHDNP